MPSDSTLNLIFRRNRISLRSSDALCEMGKHYGRKGDYAQALRAFSAAAEQDAHAPDPHYQTGYTLMLTGHYADAAQAFARCEQLAPGWFNCRSDGWTAQEVAANRMSPELYRHLNTLEDGGGSPAERVTLAEALESKAGDWGVFYLHYGKALQRSDPDKARAAWEKGLTARLEDEVKTRLLASLATVATGAAERLRFARDAATLNGHLVSAAGARIMLRQETLTR